MITLPAISRCPGRVAALLVTCAGLLLSGPAPAEQAPEAYAMQADPLAPITVGPREAVGRKGMGDKVAGGVVGAALGAFGGGSGGKSAQPKTARDPTRKLDYAGFAAPAGGVETGARAAWAENQLLVSARVEDADDKGTFQTIFLQTCDGRRLYPQGYEIYQLWSEASLSVSWSRTSTVDGRVVSQESGGWSDAWTEDFGSFARGGGEELPEVPATWQRLGFDRAEGGARQLGARFNLAPQQFAELGEVALFAHTTLPAADPVTTVASHWLLRAGAEGQAVTESPATASGAAAWRDWAERCEVVSPVLVASADAPPIAAALPIGAASSAPEVARGYPLPTGLASVKATGTGRTTGHVADISVRNDSDAPIVFPVEPAYIPSSGQYQPYIVRPGDRTEVPPGATRTVPLYGYCVDVRRPPVPAGEPLPPPGEWLVPGDPAQPLTVPPRAGAGAPGRVLVPGTDQPLTRAVATDIEPEIAAPLLFAALREIERATGELQASGDLQTPFSANPEKEREAVIQQTFWLYAAELEGEPYTREEFTRRLEQQHEQRSGAPIAAAPPEERERLQQGADDFWDAFELVGAEAKVISHPETQPVAASGAIADGKAPVAGAAGAGCTPNEKLEHTPKTVDVKIAESYGDEEERKKIRDGIKKAVEEAAEAYATATPPATAYALWGHDHVGGISSAYAKTVFLETNDQEWVWSTDPLSTTARGSGTHTLSFAHGPECTSVVAGAAMLWLKTSSSAFDPLERSIEVFRALDAVKEVTVEYLAGKLPPGIDDAVEAGVEAITDPASDTYAAAKGVGTLTVGGATDTQTSANRVVYKRKDKEDKAIVGGGETIKKLWAADVRPGSLTSKLDAESTLEAGAQGNGLAKAYLESLYGTLLIGVCECPAGISYKVLTDNGQFIRSEGAKAAVERAIREMKEAAERIGKDIESGELDPTGENLKRRAEAELKKWGESLGGDRFEPAKPAAANSAQD
jgi:hypothetical protein